MICLTELEGKYSIMDKYMKENGEMEKCRVKECFLKKMELLLLDSGLMVINMVMVIKNGLMELSIRGISQKGRKKVTG